MQKQLLEEEVLKRDGTDSPVTKASGNSVIVSKGVVNYGFRVVLYLK